MLFKSNVCPLREQSKGLKLAEWKNPVFPVIIEALVVTEAQARDFRWIIQVVGYSMRIVDFHKLCHADGWMRLTFWHYCCKEILGVLRKIGFFG